MLFNLMLYNHLRRTYRQTQNKCPSIHVSRYVNEMLQNVTIKKSRVLLGNFPDMFGRYVADCWVIDSLPGCLRMLMRLNWFASSLRFSQ